MASDVERKFVGQTTSASYCTCKSNQSCAKSIVTKYTIGFRRSRPCPKCRRKLSQCKSYQLFVLYSIRLVLGIVFNKKSSTQLVFHDGKPNFRNCFNSCFTSGKRCIANSSFIILHLNFSFSANIHFYSCLPKK